MYLLCLGYRGADRRHQKSLLVIPRRMPVIAISKGISTGVHVQWRHHPPERTSCNYWCHGNGSDKLSVERHILNNKATEYLQTLNFNICKNVFGKPKEVLHWCFRLNCFTALVLGQLYPSPLDHSHIAIALTLSR